jgi:hypothetical protein
MGIDQIGRKGPPVGPTGAEGATGVGASSAPFPSVSQAPAAAPAAPVESTALQRLHSGELTLDGYLDVKVAEATAHLQGLGPAAVQAIRDALRDQLTSDPGLAGLVRSAQGAAAPPEDDGA